MLVTVQFLGGMSVYLGCHLSVSKGYLAMGKTALSIGADTFQFFTRSPRGGGVKPLDPEDITALAEFAREHHFGPLLAHAPYTLNPCAADEGLRGYALETMQDDLRRLEYLPGSLYNFHPGSHVKQGTEIGIEKIAEHLNRLFETPFSTTVLLETMAGKGSEVGRTFEELRAVIDRVEQGDRLGVCLDTCHVFDAGYDVVSDLDGVLEQFDRILGLERLKAVHINDSKNPMGSHKDRHEVIGGGTIGLDAMVSIITHPSLRHLPFYLETPNELPGYAREIELLRRCAAERIGEEHHG